MNYIYTVTGQYPMTEQSILDSNPNYSPTKPFIPPEGYAPVFPTPVPDVDRTTKGVREITPVYVDKIQGFEQQWEIYELTDEEKVNVLKLTSQFNDNLVFTKIDRLWNSASNYINTRISGMAIGVLTVGVIQKKPKALAVAKWSNDIWAEYYTRKSQVTAQNHVNLDFSSFGEIPFSIPELLQEVQGEFV